jgi:uncharacterized glyoxalase superfamily protein PhnB
VREAVEWLCRSLGFVERLQIGNHRAQLVFGNGSVIVTERGNSNSVTSLLVRVDDVDAHFERAEQAGARFINSPTDYPYGKDNMLQKTSAVTDPKLWGGTLVE